MNFKKLVSVRLNPNDFVRIQEVAERYGAPISSIISLGVSSFLERLYDSEGNILTTAQIRGKEIIDCESGFFPVGLVARYMGMNNVSLRSFVWRNRDSITSFYHSKKLYVSLKDIIKLYGKDKHGKKRRLRSAD